MALEIVWTKRAETGYAKIIEYLETHFAEKEIRKFVPLSGPSDHRTWRQRPLVPL